MQKFSRRDFLKASWSVFGSALCVYNRETIAANNLVSRAQEQRDDR